MGTLTLSQLKTEVKSNLGGRDDLDDRLTIHLNLAQTRIARAAAWRELDTLTSGNLSYTGTAIDDKFLSMPSGTRHVYSIRLILGSGKSRRLRRVTKKYLDTKIPEPEYYTAGKPSIYTFFGGSVEMWKVPDSAYSYTIRSTKWPTAFADASDIASDLDEKDDMIIALATSTLSQSVGKLELAGRYWTMYTAMLSDAIIENNTQPDSDIMPDKEIEKQPNDYWNDPFVRSVK